MTDINELERLMGTLKKNREKVPEGELKTKYAKAYRGLKEKIAGCISSAVSERVLDGIAIKKGDGDGVLKAIQSEIKRRMPEIGQSIFRRYDIAEFERLVEGLRAAAWDLWMPYWQRHCGLYVLPENWEQDGGTPRIYNDLTGEFLMDEEKGIWERHPEWESREACFLTADVCKLLFGDEGEVETE